MLPRLQVLRNRLGLTDERALHDAERTLTEIAASTLDFELPPYDLDYLQRIHRALFIDIYKWAGELRTVDISKGGTHFCNVTRIEAESAKLFRRLAAANWFEGQARHDLVCAVAELYGDLNMIHPLREGNGRAQRILFDHIIINAGDEISWWEVGEREWIQANIDAVVCDYRALAEIFQRCIGQAIA